MAPELGRTGWSFVVLNDAGCVIAAAYGVPPPWVAGIEGAEAWALIQATRFTVPARSKYWPDCLPLMSAVAKGREAADDPRNVLARTHTMLATAFEEVEPSNHVGWMPAHLKSWELGTATKSDGSLVNQQDWEANDLADKLAKAAVEFHRVDAADVKLWNRQMQIAEANGSDAQLMRRTAIVSFRSVTPRPHDGMRMRQNDLVKMRRRASMGGNAEPREQRRPSALSRVDITCNR